MSNVIGGRFLPSSLKGLQATAVKIDSSAKEERDIPSGFSTALLPHLRIWKNKGLRTFDTNIKPKKIFDDVFADRIYYVDIATGADTNAGTISAPFKSLKKAISTDSTSAKLTVYIKAGTYTDADGWNGININSVHTMVNLIGYGGVVIANHTAASSNFKFGSGRKMYIENIVFQGGTYPFYAVTTALSNNELYAKNCAFSGATVNNGLNWDGNGIVVLENCISKNNALDGFNYHNTANTVANRQLQVIEINCKATANGSIGTTNNGSTFHNHAQGIRINGEYYSNGNRNIHDIDYSKSWNLGCYAHDNVEANNGNFCVAQSGSDETLMWLDSCISSGATSKDVYNYNEASGSIIYAYDFDGTGGSTVVYTPVAYEY